MTIATIVFCTIIIVLSVSCTIKSIIILTSSVLIVIQVIIMSLFRCVAIMCFYALKAVRQSLSENLCETLEITYKTGHQLEITTL